MSVHYVYGVLPGGQHPPGLADGPDGVAVQLVEADGLAAAVSELPADRYGEEEFRAHAEDPVWLQELAAAHHRVLASIAMHGDVVPLRMPTLCRSRQSVLELLDTRGDALRDALASVRGRVEWGVKLFAKPPPAEEPKIEAASGRDYLGQRMAQGRARDEERLRRGDVVRACHTALSMVAVDATVNAPQDPALSGRREPMVLNAAYLVARELENAFLAVLDAHGTGPCREAGILTELTGPWPPYNFSRGRLSEDDHAPAGGP
jgi:Gas vesicle synthesis protein GvpL/GvpF